MIREVKYNGYSARPSDHECLDGDLAMALGVVPENGALKPVLPPADKMQLENGSRVLYIHRSSEFMHYIIHNKSNEVRWTTGELPTPVESGTGEETADAGASGTSIEVLPIPISATLGVFETIYQITSVGNTLIILAPDGMHYYLWKNNTVGYKSLGTKIPECPMSFGLQGEMVRSDEFDITFDEINGDDLWKEFTDSNKDRITDQVLAHVNKFIAERSTNSGKFIYPFFVRYAYRLYDGSLTMHSSPVLMYASTDIAPQVFWTDFDYKKRKDLYTGAKLRIVGMLHKLDYALEVNTIEELTALRNQLEEWKDIVRSVDIFISAPIYTYDQNGKCTKFTDADEEYHRKNFSVCKHINQAVSQTTYPLQYQRHEFDKLYAFTFSPEDLSYTTKHLLIPRRSVDDVKQDIRSIAHFYLLDSISIDSLANVRTVINVPEDYLQSLVTREVMTDDWDSHDRLIPQYSFAYNSRLNIANLSKELYADYRAGALFTYTDGYVLNYGNVSPTHDNEPIDIEAYFFIRQDGKNVVVKGKSSKASHFPQFQFVYYPNPNAYKVVFVAHVDGSGLPNCYEVPLEQHQFLSGAFYFKGWSQPAISGRVPTPSTREQRILSLPNKIYTSEINNPFYFPLLGINTVGSGKVLGISSAVRALSEGQFGQFPLYAFTTEGVWALEVSGTGSYTARQPVARDVCINPESITQIDGAVLFATDRGIMMISGSQVQCISELLDSERLFDLTDLPNAAELRGIYNSMVGETYSLDDLRMVPFLVFLKKCRMIYDYTNQRIIVYNPEICYAYVYSMRSRMWGMMFCDILNNVNSYPEALAMSGDFRLVDFSTSTATDVGTFIVTRPFKLGDTDVYKTIDTLIQKGYMQRTHVLQVLYGTTDYFNWHTIWSSMDKYLRGFRGTPYKAFRLVLLCQLDIHEDIAGFDVRFTPRMTNKPR